MAKEPYFLKYIANEVIVITRLRVQYQIYINQARGPYARGRG